ncbi:MAG: prepilin-type N-terminal cleavage/methylation domain-containing protein [bacterium]
MGVTASHKTNRRYERMKGLKGFTLIELLIVVAIIGILAAIAVPNFLNAQVRAKVARAESEMRSLQNALESFFIDNNSYPPMNSGDRNLKRQYREGFDEPDGATLEHAHIATGARSDRRIYLTTPVAYISSIPFDPFHGDGQSDSYGYGSDGTSYYILTSFGPDQQDGHGSVADLNEWRYTGARLNDYRRKATRQQKGNFSLPEMVYDPSNGTSSSGDILRVGP